ncbi:MAG: hypothetical protein WCT36_02340 [Candidatus Gracilibacteria bacterium]
MAQAGTIPRLEEPATETTADQLQAPATAEARHELAAPETTQPALTGEAAETSLAARKALLKAGTVDGGAETTLAPKPDLQAAKEESKAGAALQATDSAEVPTPITPSTPEASSEAPVSQPTGWFGRAWASIKRIFGQGGQTAASIVRGPKKAE